MFQEISIFLSEGGLYQQAFGVIINSITVGLGLAFPFILLSSWLKRRNRNPRPFVFVYSCAGLLVVLGVGVISFLERNRAPVKSVWFELAQDGTPQVATMHQFSPSRFKKVAQGYIRRSEGGRLTDAVKVVTPVREIAWHVDGPVGWFTPGDADRRVELYEVATLRRIASSQEIAQIAGLQDQEWRIEEHVAFKVRLEGQDGSMVTLTAEDIVGAPLNTLVPAGCQFRSKLTRATAPELFNPRAAQWAQPEPGCVAEPNGELSLLVHDDKKFGDIELLVTLKNGSEILWTKTSAELFGSDRVVLGAVSLSRGVMVVTTASGWLDFWLLAPNDGRVVESWSWKV